MNKLDTSTLFLRLWKLKQYFIMTPFVFAIMLGSIIYNHFTEYETFPFAYAPLTFFALWSIQLVLFIQRYRLYVNIIDECDSFSVLELMKRVQAYKDFIIIDMYRIYHSNEMEEESEVVIYEMLRRNIIKKKPKDLKTSIFLLEQERKVSRTYGVLLNDSFLYVIPMYDPLPFIIPLDKIIESKTVMRLHPYKLFVRERVLLFKYSQNNRVKSISLEAGSTDEWIETLNKLGIKVKA